jgi:hypothetical protein
MDSFYLIVVAIAVFLLILCLTGVGILMGYQDANLTFPPSQNACPDGWTAVGSTCSPPEGVTIQGLTNGQQGYDQPNGTIDFSNAHWADICTKKKWANMYNINWDGISNYTKC